VKANAHIVARWRWVLALCILALCPVIAQRINFGAYTNSQNISLLVSGSLNFNDKQPAIGSNSNSTVTIALSDNQAQYITITADATRDITITVTAPTTLVNGGGGSGNEIPFTCQFAYSNLGSLTVLAAKAAAVQVPGGYTTITLPMLRRASGTPLPPPTPAHGGYTPTTTTAYLFLYGALGPVGNVTAGSYSGTISVSVQYQ
jgi:hypothetical protein